MSKEIAGPMPTADSSPDSSFAFSSLSAASAVLDPPVATEAPRVPVARPYTANNKGRPATTSSRKLRTSNTAAPVHRFTAIPTEDHGHNRQAELFYLQKQIQLQTQMVIVLEDGARIQGVIEWYDRNSIKVRGKARVLIYKAAIKYLFKAGENGDE